MNKIVVLGSVNMDLVVYVDKKPIDGETISGNSFLKNYGGKGANQAVSMARLGSDVIFIGALGNDSFGAELLGGLKNENINCENIEILSQNSGIAIITVDKAGQNSIVVIGGANKAIKSSDIDFSILSQNDIKFVVCQFEVPFAVCKDLFIEAKKNNINTVLNPSPIENMDNDILKYTDYLILNEVEFEHISKYSIKNIDKDEVLKTVKDIGVPNCIITMGSQGSYVYSKFENIFEFLPSYKVNAIDTTAAGDSFLGGFISHLNDGNGFLDSCKYAMKVGALTVLKKGAQSSLPYKKEVDDFKI